MPLRQQSAGRSCRVHHAFDTMVDEATIISILIYVVHVQYEDEDELQLLSYKITATATRTDITL